MGVAVPDAQVIVNAGAKALLTNITSAAPVTGKLTGNKVDLFTNNLNPTGNNVLADFTKAAYAGYAHATVAGWGAQNTLVDGRVSMAATNLMEFLGPAAGSGPTIYGYIVADSAGTTLLYAVKFGTPVTLTDNTKTLDLVVTFVLPNVQ